MMDPIVYNLAINILSCTVYDFLKSEVKITSAIVKDKLRNWLDIADNDSEIIAKTINNTPDSYKINEEMFKAFIKTNQDIMKSLSNSKVINNNSISGGTFNNSSVNQGGSIQNQTINYGQISETNKED